MSDRPLNANQSRVLRWLVMIPVSLMLATVVLSLLSGMVPDNVSSKASGEVKFWAVLVVAGVGCGVVEWVGRRGRRGGAPSGQGASDG